MNNLLTRTVSGAVFVALVVCSILISPYTFAALFSIFTVVGLYEWHYEVNKKEGSDTPPFVGILAGVLLFLACFAYSSGWNGKVLSGIYGLCVLCVVFAELFRKSSQPIRNIAYFVWGQVYIALPMGILCFVLFYYDWQPVLLLALLVTIWMNDSWAYLFGVSFGRHKMFERVSPKKSWEGFVGGAVMSLLTGVLLWYVTPLVSDLTYPLWWWLFFAEVVVLAGTLGDLLESLLKRSLDIKDFGYIIPGHGGVLDRFDSLLTATVAVWILLVLCPL